MSRGRPRLHNGSGQYAQSYERSDERPSRRPGGQGFHGASSESTDVAESVDVHQPVFLYKSHAKTAGEILAITQEFVTRTT
jgi:hypothetical protein